MTDCSYNDDCTSEMIKDDKPGRWRRIRIAIIAVLLLLGITLLL